MEQITISVAEYDRSALDGDVGRAVEKVRQENPVAAYAVSDVYWQIGTSAGETLVLLQVSYRHTEMEIKNILTVQDNAQAMDAIGQALHSCDAGIVLKIENYVAEVFQLAIESYATAMPQYVMEMPQVTVSVYPDSGVCRVVEIRFGYVNGRDVLLGMQEQVLTLFDSSVNIASMTDTEKKRYTQLYALLLERFQKYTIETSITPAYSLLLHGVGDSRAFAVVFAAMCREAGLYCETVAGTKSGKLWYWNIVQIDGVYYHVDLLRSKGEGSMRLLTDSIINEGYVWDFSAYPACGGKQ